MVTLSRGCCNRKCHCSHWVWSYDHKSLILICQQCFDCYIAPKTWRNPQVRHIWNYRAVWILLVVTNDRHWKYLDFSAMGDIFTRTPSHSYGGHHDRLIPGSNYSTLPSFTDKIFMEENFPYNPRGAGYFSQWNGTVMPQSWFQKIPVPPILCFILWILHKLMFA